MIGVGDASPRRSYRARRRRARRRAASSRSRFSPRRAWRCSTARSSRPPMLWSACSRPRALFRSALVTGAFSTDARARLGYAVRRPHPCAATPSGPDRVAAALRALMAGSAIRASHLTGDERGPGPLLPALPAAGDGRLPRSPAQRRRHAGRPRPTRVTDNPADLRR